MLQINVKPEIKELPISSIKSIPGNARDITSEALKGLSVSVERFGYVDLLIVNKRNHELISGLQRYKVLLASGIKKIKCIVLDVDQDQAKLIRLALNNNAIEGFWTKDLLPLLEELKDLEGFEDLRLNALREKMSFLELEGITVKLKDAKGLLASADVECPSCGFVFSPEIKHAKKN